MSAKTGNMLYGLLWAGLYLLALMPFRVLYAISDVLCFVTSEIVRYRRKLVETNIREAFPEMPEKERKRIVRKFYRHFTDTFVETIKLLHVSDDEMRRRIVFENVEKVNEYTRAGKSIGIYAAHYCNWEWLSSVTLWADNSDKIHYSQVYRPLRNRLFDRFYFDLRKRFHSDSLPKNGVLRALLGYRRSGGYFVTGFISDQKPSHNDGAHHIQFLNQDTPFITGTELLLRKLDAAVMYFDVRKVKRGYYRVVMTDIAPSAAECGEFEITDKFAALLERAIRRQPECWLWSHNRWRRNIN